ncbi:MAG: hypothetical protein HY585_00170 [Candidatus Omnitrophica bacterium]|nr:hypothetical protein [Candidatus Omnitrophota bacterium]
MKRVPVNFFAVLAIFVLCIYFVPMSFAAEDPALVAKGKQLFENKEGLSTKIACILCHKGDKAIPADKAQQLGDQLPDTINKYVVEKAKGTAIAKDNEEMKALEAYLRSGQS